MTWSSGPDRLLPPARGECFKEAFLQPVLLFFYCSSSTKDYNGGKSEDGHRNELSTVESH